jgi:hypothetical protein
VDFARRYFGNSYWPKHDEEETTQQDAWYAVIWKSLVWYGILMPLWCTIATIGSIKVRRHQEDMALKSPHPIRIGKVQQKLILEMAAKKLESSDKDFAPLLIRADSLHMVGDRKILPPAFYQKKLRPINVEEPLRPVNVEEPKLLPQSFAVYEEAPPEEDPQADPPRVIDFVIAVGYMILESLHLQPVSCLLPFASSTTLTYLGPAIQCLSTYRPLNGSQTGAVELGVI